MGHSAATVSTCCGCADCDVDSQEKIQQFDGAPLKSVWANEAVGLNGCSPLESTCRYVVASANCHDLDASEEMLLNHELLQCARQGDLSGLTSALERGAWTETRRPLAIMSRKPDAPGANGRGHLAKQPEVGMTPLMFASQAGSADCVMRLVSAGARVNAVEEDGWSAMHFAAKEGHYQACAALLGFRANPNLQNHDGQTPLQIAQEDEDCRTFVERFEMLLAGKPMETEEPETRTACVQRVIG